MFKTDHKLWKTSTGLQYGSPSPNRCVLPLLGCVHVLAPTRCRAQQITTASARPRAGAVALVPAQKNPCTERAGVSNAEKVGDYASNLAVWRRAVWSRGDRLETLA